MAALNDQVGSILDRLFADTLVGGVNVVKDATLRIPTEGAYDTATGEPSITWTESSIKGIYGKPYNQWQVQNSGGAIQAGDVRFIVRASGGDGIGPGAEVVIGGVKHKVVYVETKSLGDDELTRVLQLRK